MTSQRKPFVGKGCWIVGATVLFAPILLFILISQFTPILIIWIVRSLIGLNSYGEPINMEEIKQNVTVVSDISYGEEHNNTLDIYYPSNAETPLPLVVYIHGGGFVWADKSHLQSYAMAIANEGYVVANINYGLAPEQPYPVGITNVNQALAYLSENIASYGGDIDHLFIAGNSAGAHLTSQIAAVITNDTYANQMNLQPAITPEQLQGIILLNGIYNMETLRATGFPNIEFYLWAYTGTRQFESYEHIDDISIIQHVTPEYPPAFITVGNIDPLESQTMEMLEALQANQVDVTSVLFEASASELDHDFMLNLDQPDSQETFRRVIEFLHQYDD